MPQAKVLDKNSKINGNNVVVTKTIEETLSLQDLRNGKQNLQHQRHSVQQQLDHFSQQLKAIDDQDKEFDELIDMLETESTSTK